MKTTGWAKRGELSGLAYRVYYLDTFDNEAFLQDSFDELVEAEVYVNDKYKDSLSSSGADQVEIVDKSGSIVRTFQVR